MERRNHGDTWWVITFVIGVIALVMGAVALAVAADDPDKTAGASASESAGGEAATSNGGQVTFDVVLRDISVQPNMIEVPAGATITLNVTNEGVLDHDLKVEGGDVGARLLKSGETEVVEVGPFTADTTIWCTVPGHKEAGMAIAVHVIGGEAAAGESAGAAGPAVDDSAVIDAAGMPSDGWEAFDPVLDPAPTGTLHEITLDAIDVELEVAPGVTQLAWTFNGTVPGPTLRGKVGDTFRITLNNKGTMGHSIDFHASKVAWNDEMRTIAPGESLVYEFTADFAGAWMYHCGTAPALHHIGNGMFGAIIIDPPDLAPVEEEFIMVQSELYLGPQGEPADLGKMLEEDWDAVVFNGYWTQYMFAPIHVEAGKRYRVWVVDDGPSENSAFHIVGTIFDTVFKEGAYLLQPDESRGGSQVLDLQPAQGGFVEFTFAEDGLYPFVTHKFANASKGALGFFAVGDVDTSALTGH